MQVRRFELVLLPALFAAAAACGDNDLSPIRRPTEVDAGPGTPGTFNVFEQVPQFGMYVKREPANYAPPPGVLMWNYGTEFVAKLTAEQKRAIGSDLQAKVTYHAQCDEYTRLGHLFAVLTPPGQSPNKDDPRIELARFTTPFSDFSRGALATYVFPSADLSTFAAALAGASRDTWIGIAGGSNPREDDACAGTSQSADFRAIGFKYSLDLVSTLPRAGGPGVALAALYNFSAMSVPITGAFVHQGSETIAGRVTTFITGHGTGLSTVELMNTDNSVTLNGAEIGSFNTRIDCATYAQYSPVGNPGLFVNNNTTNPRNWCPGALAPPHTLAATLHPGSNSVSLSVTPPTMPAGSLYPTSITFSSP